ncbi:hypothetical protein V8F33_007588 [Rhypophila sp. PSN 637]
MSTATSPFYYLLSSIFTISIALVFAGLVFPGKIFQWDRGLQGPYVNARHDAVSDGNPEPKSRPGEREKDKTTTQTDDSSPESLYKSLYHKLHNLEDHLDIIPQALNTLLDLFSSAIKFSQAGVGGSRENSCIFHLSKEYDSHELRTVLKRSQDVVFAKWEEYVAQREDGGNRVMFTDRPSAIRWLKQMAPLKFVDGAWLGHINRAATAPFHFSDVTKTLWQILSEEYGDGDLKKHHVHVYRQLLQTHAVPELPRADSPDFIGQSGGLNTTLPVWRAAVGQLLISLFAHHFLPEVVGFNLHFEGITLQTLIAAKELGELDMDPAYFHLHISIDNADSGHSAMAVQAVERYLAKVESKYGAVAMKQDWRRIQIGFSLSQYLCETLSLDDGSTMYSKGQYNNGGSSKKMAMAEIESRFVELVQRKCISADKLHCSSRAKLGDRMISDWLDPEVLSYREKQSEFVRCLANARWWVQKGDSANSRLVKELSWGGRMFGSFTNSEVDTVKSWIESLSGNEEEEQEEAGSQAGSPYWSFSGRSKPVVEGYPPLYQSLVSGHPESSFKPQPFDTDNIDMTKLLPLWFAQMSLLQSLISIPARSATQAGCAVLRFLRAQEGFEIEGSAVAGTDETMRTNVIGILELGLEMTEAVGLTMPGSLADAIKEWASEAAVKMLHLAMLPKRSARLLIGITWAFVDLHDSLSSVDGESCFRYLSQTSHRALREICRRERDSLARYVENMEPDSTDPREIWKGYTWGRRQIQSCFG